MFRYVMAVISGNFYLFIFLYSLFSKKVFVNQRRVRLLSNWNLTGWAIPDYDFLNGRRTTWTNSPNTIESWRLKGGKPKPIDLDFEGMETGTGQENTSELNWFHSPETPGKKSDKVVMF